MRYLRSNRSAKRIGLFAVFAVVFACGGDDVLIPPEHINFPVSRDITYNARNTSPDPIHVYDSRGTRGESNRVPPGGSILLHTQPYTWDSESDFVNINLEASNNLGAFASGSIAYTGKNLEQGIIVTAVYDGHTLTLSK